MKPLAHIVIVTLGILVLRDTAMATIRYADVNSASPTPPYTSWSNAATNIQDAVNAANAGDEILVTNGVYQTGATAINGMSNRLAVTKPVTVQSVNGPAYTTIVGYQDPGSTNGPSAIRCAYLTNGAVLAGFTLTKGATHNSGDDQNYSGGGVWCESASAVVSNCTLTGNSAYWYGGGVYRGTLDNCTLTSNSVYGFGGGGASSSVLNNCTIASNSAHFGGGTSGGTLNNCALTGNMARFEAGGSYGGTLNNCTLTGNSAESYGGGASEGTLNNCIAYYNDAPIEANHHYCSLRYCCTTPMPASGVDNITNAPLFIDLAAGNLHLQPTSPCIDAGTNLSSIIMNDLDGRPRPLDGNADGVAAFDMGAYEHAVIFVRQDSPNPAPPFKDWLTAATNIQDAADLTLGGAGDQILVTNGVYQFGGNATGRVALSNALTSLQSVNGPQYTTINGGGSVRCVLMANGTSLSGFTLTNGVAAGAGGGVAFSGFNSDAVVSNCVLIGNSAASGGGAASAVVTGGNLPSGGTLVDCAIYSNSATAFQPGNSTLGIGGGVDNCKLSGCALVGNFAAYGGGGASASQLVNCRVTGNLANAEGGGTRWSWLHNCLLTGNSSGAGASFSSTLVNCTLTANPAGGAYFGFLTNCIVYDNGGGWNQIGATMSYCCTTPLPVGGIGNITNTPLFVDQASGNFRLQYGSPCINAGNNSDVTDGTDLDGRTRIVSDTVDIGAYEFQPDVSGEFIGWLSQYGLPTDGSADYADGDGDLMNNWQEWIAGTVPTDASSLFRMVSPIADASGVTVSWQSMSNRTYFLERTPDLGPTLLFSMIASNIVGQPGTTAFTDTNAIGTGPFFYRVGVQLH